MSPPRPPESTEASEVPGAANPYRTPQASVADPQPAHAPARVLDPRGRLGRLRYLVYSFGFSLLFHGLLAAGAGAGALAGPPLGPALGGGLALAAAIGSLVTTILLAIQRLHDFNASAWWVILLLVPGVNLVLVLVLWVMPGTRGPNRFAAPTPPNTPGIVVLALLLPALLLGLIALPVLEYYLDRSAAAQAHVAGAGGR